MSDHSNEKKSRKLGGIGACSLPAGLYLVATPIGNLRDMTLRAIDTLRDADIIACEDTRVSGKLLKAYDISTKMMPYHDHSDEGVRKKILAMIAEGKSVALISDAGSPLISDPGYKLVRDARDLGLYVTTIPGACAVVSAVQLSSLPHEAFTFIGFLPSKEKAREEMLQKWSSAQGLIVAYETAPRLIAALKAVEKVMGARRVTVTREITKMYEEARTESVANLIAHYEREGAPKGEIVLVIGAPLAKAYTDSDIDDLLREAMSESSTKEAAASVARITGKAKKDLYNRALEIK